MACWLLLIPPAELQVATPPATPAATPTAAAPTTLEQKPTAETVHTRDAHMLSVWQTVGNKVLSQNYFIWMTYLFLCVMMLFRPITAWHLAVFSHCG